MPESFFVTGKQYLYGIIKFRIDPVFGVDLLSRPVDDLCTVNCYLNKKNETADTSYHP